jgi:hypothetical protein
MCNEIAKTIYNQLGNKSLFMIGAKNFVFDENSLSFRVRGSNKVNLINIKLNGLDLYDMTFYKISGSKCNVVKYELGIYNDMLNTMIEENTGLYTNL